MGLSTEDPNFWSRFIGMIVVAGLLGFVIGAGLGLAVTAVIKNFNSENFPTKLIINTGGGVGAIFGMYIVYYFIFA